jgi:hypothetical protein
MDMVETEIVEGRWRYRDDVPCVYNFQIMLLLFFFLLSELILMALGALERQ